jgi:hypothetical protein
VTAHAAVAVDDDLAAREAGVRVRPAEHEAARRVDVDLRLLVDEVRRDRGLDDRVDDRVLDLRV